MTVIRKLLWLIGFFALLAVKFELYKSLGQENIDLFKWFEVGTSFILGIYVSLILIKTWSLRVNYGLFWFVALPITIVAFLSPFAFTSSLPSFLMSSELVTWLFRTSLYNPVLLGFLSGILLPFSLFSGAITLKKQQG